MKIIGLILKVLHVLKTSGMSSTVNAIFAWYYTQCFKVAMIRPFNARPFFLEGIDGFTDNYIKTVK
jgi:hypothetical protein